MNYEAWRISFQDSDLAAKAAFEESQRWERLFAMAIGSVVELTEAAGIRKEYQLTGGNFQALIAIEKLKERREKWKARALKAEKDRDDYHIAEQRQIALRQKMEVERDVLAAYQTDLIHELTACQSVLHMLAHDRQVTPAYANDAKAVLRRAPEACLANRDAEQKLIGKQEMMPLVELLGGIAQAAFYLADDTMDDVSADQLLLDKDSYEALCKAFAACEHLPEPEEGYVSEGWCRALRTLRQQANVVATLGGAE